jgi:hypothetical protein
VRTATHARALLLLTGSLGFLASGATGRAQDQPRGLETRGAGALPHTASSEGRDPLAALSRPLSPDERDALLDLAEALGSSRLAARTDAAAAIRARFGARAAGPLLELSQRDLDPERRFRERALVASLVHGAYTAKAHDCGWLGVRWQMSRTEEKCFTVHVVDPVPGDPAALSGLQKDDEIVLWNGEAIDGPDDFIDRVQTAVPGSTVPLSVERARSGRTERIVIPVVMGKREEPQKGNELAWFHRDLATRQLARWLAAWQKARRD